jgi:hypothetical protein
MKVDTTLYHPTWTGKFNDQEEILKARAEARRLGAGPTIVDVWYKYRHPQMDQSRWSERYVAADTWAKARDLIANDPGDVRCSFRFTSSPVWFDILDLDAVEDWNDEWFDMKLRGSLLYYHTQHNRWVTTQLQSDRLWLLRTLMDQYNAPWGQQLPRWADLHRNARQVGQCVNVDSMRVFEDENGKRWTGPTWCSDSRWIRGIPSALQSSEPFHQYAVPTAWDGERWCGRYVWERV